MGTCLDPVAAGTLLERAVSYSPMLCAHCASPLPAHARQLDDAGVVQRCGGAATRLLQVGATIHAGNGCRRERARAVGAQHGGVRYGSLQEGASSHRIQARSHRFPVTRVARRRAVVAPRRAAPRGGVVTRQEGCPASASVVSRRSPVPSRLMMYRSDGEASSAGAGEYELRPSGRPGRGGRLRSARSPATRSQRGARAALVAHDSMVSRHVPREPSREPSGDHK